VFRVARSRPGATLFPYTTLFRSDFEVEISSPGKNKPGTTNTEKLFVLGYSACYNSALDAVKAVENVDGKAVVRHHVDLLKKPDEVDFKLAVLIEEWIEGMDPAEVQTLADKADENVDGKAVVRHHVDLLKKPDEVDFKLAVLIEVGIEGMDPAEVQPLADKAHAVCPYSKAVKNGDIDVEVKAVAFEDTK